MRVLTPQRQHRGAIIETQWSADVQVTDVLYSVEIDDHVFHGVKSVNLDINWDWHHIENLLWITEEEGVLSPWRGPIPSHVAYGSKYNTEYVVGDYVSTVGNVYWAIKWSGFDCPTWVLEDDLVGEAFDALGSQDAPQT